jgi:hypothetical protein
MTTIDGARSSFGFAMRGGKMFLRRREPQILPEIA